MRPETLWKNEEKFKENIKLNNKLITRNTRKSKKRSRSNDENNVNDENHIKSNDGSPIRRKNSRVLGDLNNNKLLSRSDFQFGNVLGNVNNLNNGIKAPPRKEAEPSFKVPQSQGPFTSPVRKNNYNNDYLQDILNSSPGTMLKTVFNDSSDKNSNSNSNNGNKLAIDPRLESLSSSNPSSNSNTFEVNSSNNGTKKSSSLKYSYSSDLNNDDDDDDNEDGDDDDQTIIGNINDNNFNNQKDNGTPFDFNQLPPSSPPSDLNNFLSPFQDNKTNGINLQLPSLALPKSKNDNDEDEDETDELASSPQSDHQYLGNRNDLTLDQLVNLFKNDNNKRLDNDDDSPFIVETPPEELYPS